MDEWRTIQPIVWRPLKEGDNISGILVNKEPKDENSSISAKYYIDTEKGTFFVWGSTVLDDRMQYVKVGQKIRITFEGKTRNKRGQPMNLFKVEVANSFYETEYKSDPTAEARKTKPSELAETESIPSHKSD